MSSEPSEAPLEETILFWRDYLSKPNLLSDERMAASMNLANAVSDLAEGTGNPELCDEAVSLGDQALQLARESPLHRRSILSDLSTIYLTRFELQGQRADLETSLEHIRKSAEETPKNEPSRLLRYANLVNTLCSMFETFGSTKHLQEAIKCSEELAFTENNDANIHAKALANRGRALMLRYELYLILSDLEAAIDVTEKALEIAEDHNVKEVCASNLAGLRVALVERNINSESILNNAISHSEKIYDAFEGPDKARLAHNLSYLYRLDFERQDNSGSPQALQKALDYATDAVNLAADETNISMFLDQYAILLDHAHSISPSQGYLDSAIDAAKQAVGGIPGSYSAGASYKNHLADFLKKRNEANDAQEAIRMSEEVLYSDSADLLVRIAAGQQCGFLYAERKEWIKAHDVLAAAVNMVQNLTKNSLQRSDQQHILSHLVGLSQSAASIALQAGKSAAEAFHILERGRAILIELSIASRSTYVPRLGLIPEAKPLLERHSELKTVLASNTFISKGSDGFELSDNAMTSIRLQILEELGGIEKLLDDIAKNHGVDTAITIDKDIIQAIGGDYAVAFNVTKYRSDAFIISKRGVESISLLPLSPEEITKQVKKFLGPDRITKIRSTTYRKFNAKLQEVLEWLWKSAVKPVLAYLDLLRPNITGSRLPRLCWITSGALGLLPLHASGDHSEDSKEFAMNYVISSYTVSSRSFSWCREQISSRAVRESSTELRAALITMPDTPGAASLDHVNQETQALRLAFPQATEECKPSAHQLLEQLHSLNVAHFVCHAEPNTDDPSEGSVLLYNKDENSVDKLSIYEISQVNSAAAWLAYLSACQTADIQDLDFLDEVIHIAGAFQIAGFPQVIGTLWQAEDDYALSVAKAFYGHPQLKSMCQTEQPIDRDIAVFAFHEAVSAIRAEDPELVLSWAQFVVFGA
jgi:CHAT domain-containing protein